MNAVTAKPTRLARRIDVVLNYSTLIVMLAVFIYITRQSITVPIIIIGFIAALFFIISFVNLQVKTKLWKFVHTKIENLDEREIQIIFQSLRYSYTVFAVICLSFFLVYELQKELVPDGINLPLMPIIVVLLYLAHTLPASIIAWTEKEV